jgi:multiple sugar transport system permease protein
MIFRSLGLRDTLISLIIPYTVFSLPIAIWMLAGYFKQIPKELELSAKLDGCSGFTIFWRILLPLLKTGMATTAILVFVTCWNEFIYAVAFTTTNISRTLPVYISKFPAATDNVMGQLTSTSIIGAIPLILIILLFQKKIVAGLTSGAVKE